MSDDMANQRDTFKGAISVQKKWQPDLDSNQDKVNQNHLCYRYTIRLQILQHAFNIQRKFILSRAAFHFFQKKAGNLCSKGIAASSPHQFVIPHTGRGVTLLTHPVFDHGFQNEIFQFHVQFKPVVAKGTA